MGEIIKFPTIQKPDSPTVVNENINISAEVLEFRKRAELGIKEGTLKACLFEGAPTITVGGEVVVEVCERKYKGIVTDILQRDENNNVTRIAYSISFLNGDDPFKFGEADFIYKIEKYD